jgi:hypothetical protein
MMSPVIMVGAVLGEGSARTLKAPGADDPKPIGVTLLSEMSTTFSTSPPTFRVIVQQDICILRPSAFQSSRATRRYSRRKQAQFYDIA